MTSNSRYIDYPYGMVMPNRHGPSNEVYRCGFQGQETDDEIKGEGNSVNYKYRMHDPRVGRFFAVDPLAKAYSFFSPYSFSGNRVINAVELEGLEPITVIFPFLDPRAPSGLYAYFTTKTTRSGILFVTDKFLIRRQLTKLELTNSRNTQIVARASEVTHGTFDYNGNKPGIMAEQSTPTTPNTAESWRPTVQTAGASIINVTSLFNPSIVDNLSENGIYPFAPSQPNTVENQIAADNKNGIQVSIPFAIASGETGGVSGQITFNQFGTLQNFQLLDSKGSAIPLTLGVSKSPPPTTTGNGNLIGTGPTNPTYFFRIAAGSTSGQLTLVVTPTSTTSGTFEATVSTSGSNDDARTTANPSANNIPAGVSVSTNGLSVEPKRTGTSEVRINE